LAGSQGLEVGLSPSSEPLIVDVGCWISVGSSSNTLCSLAVGYALFHPSEPDPLCPSFKSFSKMLIVPMVADGVFFPKNPKELLVEKQFKNIPYIVGINHDEFGWILPTMLEYPLSEDRLDQEKATALLWSSYPLVRIPKDLTPVITEQYLGVTEDSIKKKWLFLDMLGDLFFGIPSVIAARHHRDSGAPTYLYQFEHRPSFWGNLKPMAISADHGDELFFVFGIPFAN
ncbi:liver carboxylesterase-like, partial [Gracilinanus agilis]|uniref:liver carboxylesterase-like n=1 Tax=Gracilinanus agilis TaxID=191870 RepID=UPI001CFEE901